MLSAQLQFCGDHRNRNDKIETKILRKLAKQGKLGRRENADWTEMAHIPMEELIKILQEAEGNVKIGP